MRGKNLLAGDGGRTRGKRKCSGGQEELGQGKKGRCRHRAHKWVKGESFPCLPSEGLESAPSSGRDKTKEDLV